ncbi:MAG: hemolysin family protein, partial [Parachlamydiaceae bacterium]
NTLVNILIQNTTSHIFGETASWTLKVGVPFVLMLFFGEIIPKNFGLQNSVRISSMIAPSINFLQKILSPVRSLIVEITVPVSRAMFFYLKPNQTISKHELKHVLKTSQDYGVLHPDEAELVWGVLNLQDATVKSLMRPREDILYYDINDPLSKLTYLFTDQQCFRIPVCDGSLDNILGMMNARHFFLLCRKINDSNELKPHLLTPLYVPENMSARSLFKRFTEWQRELALVVDEYGSISGLITTEDLVEEVVGDIADIRDAGILFTQAGLKEIIASGRLELETLNEHFGVNLISENNMQTIGGWLIEKYGDIPTSGTKIEIEHFLFHVLSAEPNRIRRLYIQYLK